MSSLARAQAASPIHQGGWIVGGSASLGRAHDDLLDGDRTHFAIQPLGLTFITPRLAVGGSVGLSYIDEPNGHSYSFGVGPSARYFFASDPSAWLPFVSATVQPSWTKEHFDVLTVTGTGTTTSTIDATVRSTSIDGSFGLTRLLATHVGLTGEAYYTNNHLSNDMPNSRSRTTRDFGVRFGLTIFVH